MKYQVQENCLTIFLPREVDHHNAEKIRRRADRLIEKHHIKCVIFDFDETNFMDSSGIGVIMGRYKQMSYVGGKVFVRGIGKSVDRIFQMSGLYKLVTRLDAAEEA